jgi:hypothetical protein
LTLVLASTSAAAEPTRCNGFNDAAATWAAVRAGSDQPLELRSLDPPALLPDGSEFETWEQPAEHRRTFFVACENPEAADGNPGTDARPWKTIGRAAALLEPGDRVIVREGAYREWVRPARGGLGPKRMITYQAAPGERVVIRGSELFAGPWLASRHGDAPKIDNARMADLPASLFDGYNPFARWNVEKAESNPYWRPGKKQPPEYSMARGLVFQDGRRLRQVSEYQQLAEGSGTYWVEPGGQRLHLRCFGDKDPASVEFEITTREYAFAPEKTGLGFIRVEGFAIEYVASSFPIPQCGAISTRQGHHWIVQHNSVRQVNSLGLDFGRRPTFAPYEVPADTPKLAGVGHIIRGNHFADCGICSLQGLGLFGGLIEGNTAIGCGWQRVLRLYETGGIKLHYKKHVLVRRNLVHGTIDAPGLWVDHSNANTRVTENIVVGARGAQGGIFLEATYLPVLVDHNIVWDCEGNGFYQHDCSRLVVEHNLFGNCTRQPVLMRANPKRLIDIETNRFADCVSNRVRGNIFYGFGAAGPEMPGGKQNTSDYNVFVNPLGAKPFDLTAWQKKTGREAHSMTVTARMAVTTTDWTLRQEPPVESLLCPRNPVVRRDFFGLPRLGETTEAGPFVEAKEEVLLQPPK